MLNRRNAAVIDAGLELDRAEQERVDGSFGASELGSQRRQSPPGARTFLLVVLSCVAALMLTLTYKALRMRGTENTAETAPRETVRQVIPALTPRPVQLEPQPAPEPTQVQAHQPQPEAFPGATEPPSKSAADLVRERMLNSSLTGGESGTESVIRQERAPATAGGQGELAGRLQPLRLTAASASQLADRDLLMTQGTMLDCVLETKIISTQPGMTACHLTRDIYSTSGRVVLLDRGSKVVGFYQSGMRQGQARIFVQWSRVETPQGVVINLDSPGTGPLGEAGLGGWVDRHFQERFGGAILISLISDLGEWGSAQGQSGSGNNSIRFDNTSTGAESAATEALRNSINIPPTLYKNQGERVSIFVARDLDFSNVYSLSAR
jgi:type IV secretion system protein VirB10